MPKKIDIQKDGHCEEYMALYKQQLYLFFFWFEKDGKARKICLIRPVGYGLDRMIAEIRWACSLGDEIEVERVHPYCVGLNPNFLGMDVGEFIKDQINFME